MNKSEIRHCSCKHEFQDEMYGKNMRVHNYGEKSYKSGGGSHPGWCCTVCGTVKRAQENNGESFDFKKET